MSTKYEIWWCIEATTARSDYLLPFTARSTKRQCVADRKLAWEKRELPDHERVVRVTVLRGVSHD